MGRPMKWLWYALSVANALAIFLFAISNFPLPKECWSPTACLLSGFFLVDVVDRLPLVGTEDCGIVGFEKVLDSSRVGLG
jgi:hypothetical protein